MKFASFCFIFQVSASVLITIVDVNDNAPVFQKPSYQTSIREVGLDL